MFLSVGIVAQQLKLDLKQKGINRSADSNVIFIIAQKPQNFNRLSQIYANFLIFLVSILSIPILQVSCGKLK